MTLKIRFLTLSELITFTLQVLKIIDKKSKKIRLMKLLQMHVLGTGCQCLSA